MSELKVNKISPRSGTDVTLGDSADTITIPSGATLDASNATVTYPAGSITDAAISSTAAIQQSKISGSPGFRNIIINGDMSIAQRGTSASSLTTGGYRTVDRFNFGISSAGTWTMSQDTDVPTGQGFAKSTKLDCTTANASLGASAELIFFQKIEGQNLQYLKKGTANAESTTLSFWVKSNKTGTYTAEINDNDNNRTISQTYTISLADTWEKKTLTYAGDTTGTLDNDNAVSFWMFFWLGAGTDYTSGTLNTSWNANTTANRVSSSQVNLADDTANEWYITGVQLEAGTTASDFEFLPFDVNLQRCLRYYYTYVNGTAQSIGIGVGYNNDLVYVHINFQVEMRALPSIITSNNTSDFRSRKANIDPFDTWDGIQTQTKHQSIIYSSAQVSIATGEAVWVETNAATALLAFNSEL
jgi:hypothetical protein